MASTSKNNTKNAAMPKADPQGPKKAGSTTTSTSSSRKRAASIPADVVSPMNDHDLVEHDRETVHENENENDSFSDSGSMEPTYSAREEPTDFNMNDSEVQFDIDGNNEAQGCDDMLNSLIQENYGTKKIDEHLAPPISDLLTKTMDDWALQVPNKADIKLAF